MSEETKDTQIDPGQAVAVPVKAALGLIAKNLSGILGALDELENVPYHATVGGVGLVHNTFEATIAELRKQLEGAAESAQNAADQVVSGVPKVG